MSESDQTLYSPVATGGISTYHVDDGCPRLTDAKNVVERDREFVDWHDLSPCAYCHDDQPNDKNQGQSISNLAKRIRYGGSDD